MRPGQRSGGRAAGVALALAAVAALPMRAQDAPAALPEPWDTLPARTALRLRAGAAAEGRYAEHRVDAGNGLELSTGSLFGGRVLIGIGPHIEIEAGGATGSLTADSAQADDATLARGEGHLALLPVPWLALRVGGEIHTFSTAVAVQRWTSARVGAEGRLEFVGGKLAGLVRFELYPVMSVSGLTKPSRGFGATSGLTFASGAVTGSVLYELERYDFPQAGGLTRHEQLGYLSIAVGLRVGGW